MGFSNYFNSLKSGKDGRRKTDLQSIQRGLELYYQDIGRYPDPPLSDPLCHPNGCSRATYIQSLPKDPSRSDYVYVSDGSFYQLYACIENANDSGPGVNQAGYGQSCGGGPCDPCKFGVSSTNTTP